MSRGKAHPPETRAQVIAEIAAGESVSAVARRWGVSKSRAVEWWAQDRPFRPDNARTRERMAELIYDTLGDILSAIRLQLQAASREEWLAQQNAGDIASLLGTELDRAVRLLAGFRPAEDGGDGDRRLPEGDNPSV